MRPELREKIRDFNRRARKAKADGFQVIWGRVYTNPGPKGFAREVCRVEDYPAE